MGTKLTSIATAGIAVLALSSSSMAGQLSDSQLDQELIYGDEDYSIVKTGAHSQVASDTRSSNTPMQGSPGAELSAFELQQLDQELIYGDEDYSIVETGAR
jgi:hypothetical protein